MFDGKAFGQEVVGAVKAHMEKALAPLVARVDELEKEFASEKKVRKSDLERLVVDMSKDVKQAQTNASLQVSVNEIRAELETIKPSVERFAEAIGDEVAKAAAKAIAELPKPADGHSPTPEELAPFIYESVQRAVSAIPAPKDGKDGVDGKDGAGLVDLLIDRAGELVTTLSDGRIKNVGCVVGRNGKDGAPGKDGRDGFGFDDMTEELADDGRTIIRRYSRGEDVKEFRHKMAVVLYRGVWKEGQTYDAGDNVTWGGHSWIAKEDTDAKPEPNGGPWILHVKRGRDGKDGVLKAEKPKEPVKVG